MKKNAKEELRDLSPLLHRLRENGDGMQVPEGYFAGMQADVLRRIREENENQAAAAPPLRVAYRRRLGWIAAAASVVLLIAAGWWGFRPGPDTAAPSGFAASGLDFSGSDATAYLEAHIEDFDLALLSVLAADEEAGFPSADAESFPDGELDEYLDELELEDLEELL